VAQQAKKIDIDSDEPAEFDVTGDRGHRVNEQVARWGAARSANDREAEEYRKKFLAMDGLQRREEVRRESLREQLQKDREVQREMDDVKDQIRAAKRDLPKQSRYEKKIAQTAAATASGAAAQVLTANTAASYEPVAGQFSSRPARSARLASRIPKVKAPTAPAPKNPVRGSAVTKGPIPGPNKPYIAPKAKRKHNRARRKQFVNKIPKKYKVTRFVLKATLGTGALATQAVVGVAKPGAKVAKWSGRKVAGRAVSTAQSRKWTPAALEQKLFSTSISCCGKTFSNSQDANSHFMAEHMDEPRPTPSTEPGQPKLVPAATRRQMGKTLVLLPPGHTEKVGRGRHARALPTGRHRKTAGTSPDRLVAAYRSKITEIGARAMTDNGESRTVAQGLAAWGESRPKTLTDIRNMMAGMERAMLVGGEAVEALERYLIMPTEAGGANFTTAITRPSLRRVKDGMADAARGYAQFVALTEEIYSSFIKAPVEAPNIAMK